MRPAQRPLFPCDPLFPNRRGPKMHSGAVWKKVLSARVPKPLRSHPDPPGSRPDPPPPFLRPPTAKSIDEYIEQRAKPEAEREIDDRLVVVARAHVRALLCRRPVPPGGWRRVGDKRLDKLEEAISKSPDPADSLAYATKVCQTLVTSREFRLEVLRALVGLYDDISGDRSPQRVPVPDVPRRRRRGGEDPRRARGRE